MADGSENRPAATDENLSSRQGWRSAPDEVWARVREDYLSGVSAPETCRRHGVSESALRHRAAREGWRRIDRPWTPPNRLDPWDEGVELEARMNGHLDLVGPHDLSFIAHQRMSRAVLRGDAAEALRWRRVREAMDRDVAELDYEMEEDQAEVDAFRETRSKVALEETQKDAGAAESTVESQGSAARSAARPATGEMQGLQGLQGVLREGSERSAPDGAPRSVTPPRHRPASSCISDP